MEHVGRAYHPVNVWVVKTMPGKLKKLDELLDRSKKTIIFADTIELGKKVAAEYNIPYIYGDSIHRLDIVENNNVIVASRVLDLGISIKNLQRIIEIDFLFGCYDAQTEVLTRRGWVKFPDLKLEDTVASLANGTNMVFEKPMEIQKYKYNGKLLHFDGKGYDIMVTPNHNMYVRRRAESNNVWRFKQAGELPKTVSGLQNYELKKDAVWGEGTEPENFIIPELKTCNSTTQQMYKPALEVNYNGNVYCCTVLSGVILIRRNGKAVWCGNSRAQSIQRTGRLMHSEAEGLKHDIIMTEAELASYGKRLWSLQDQGFTVKVHE